MVKYDNHSKTSRVEIFEIHRYFSKIDGDSADTAVNALRTADAPFTVTRFGKN